MAFLPGKDEFITNIGNQIGDKTGLAEIKSGFLNNDLDQITAGIRRLGAGPQDTARDTDPFHQRDFINASSSYSGTDCVPIAQINEKLVVLGGVATFSYSIFREKSPVRVLGRSYAKGYTAGPRTIAGSMIFVVFDRNPLYEILKALDTNQGAPNDRYTSPVADQIPPIDLILWFSNEYGHKSVLRLYGVEFLQEGQTHSINDLYTENVMQYVARDIDILLTYEDVQSFRNLLYERQISGQFTDNHLTAMLEYQKKIQQQLQDVENNIYQIQQERGKRNMVTFGIWGNVSSDLKRELEKQLIVKKSLATELERLNNSILYHQQNVYGWTPSDKLEGQKSNDNLRAGNLTTPGNSTTQGNNTTPPYMYQDISIASDPPYMYQNTSISDIG